VEPYIIEDTDDWLGSPTPLETCRHSLRIYENEVQELTLQLRQSREKIYTLVEMHADPGSRRNYASRSTTWTYRREVTNAKRSACAVSSPALCLKQKQSFEIGPYTTHVGLTRCQCDQSLVTGVGDGDNSLSMRWVKLGSLGAMNHAAGGGGG
jgi:hypothetical protein